MTILSNIRTTVYWLIRWRRAVRRVTTPTPLRLAARGMVDAALEIADILLIVVVLAVLIAYIAGGA